MKKFKVLGREFVVLSKNEKEDIAKRINNISATGLATINQVASEMVPLMDEGTWKKSAWTVATARRKNDINENWNALRSIFA